MNATPHTPNELTVKFSVTKENLQNVKDAISEGTLDEAIRAAKQLVYSATTLVEFLEDLKK
jgi:hypothetical protein